MTSKADKERQKQVQDKCQALLTQMLRDDDNKYCVDCDSKGPRWASWNLGVFLCIRCAGIHRNLGVHISRVKSVTLDSWTPEQVVSLQMMGNSRARAVYEANLPDNFRRPQADSALEAFVRAKYEAKKYIAKEWVQPPLPAVNWDKEFEEEAAERNRKRKKQQEKSAPVTTNTLTPVASRKAADAVVPQPLPKPNSSPKSQRQNAASSNTAVPSSSPSKPSTDLLGLDSSIGDPVSCSSGVSSSDDMFTSFLSAPAPSAASFTSLASATANSIMNSPATAAATKRTPEEDSFFNQPVAQEKKQLTTDSILALYAKTPQPAGQPLGGASFGQVGASTAQGFIANNFGRQQTTASGQQMPTFQPQAANGMIPGMMNAMQPPPMMVNQAAASNPFYNMSAGQTAPLNFGAQPQMMSAASSMMNPPLHQQMSAMSLSQGSSSMVNNQSPAPFGAFVQSQQMVPTFQSAQNFQVMQLNMASNPSSTIPGPTLSSNLS
ncbi:stromal membrane-associated protein 1 [Nilaparvata lugens]|uniref:stromal membrane-associated protein 1 n=1 Tax=Nilaparvata lugens TaxID=108931 RepID=UPI000B999CE3|nr:stromal membrane-associated protein 1 [Nilaparvata lugens]